MKWTLYSKKATIVGYIIYFTFYIKKLLLSIVFHPKNYYCNLLRTIIIDVGTKVCKCRLSKHNTHIIYVQCSRPCLALYVITIILLYREVLYKTLSAQFNFYAVRITLICSSRDLNWRYRWSGTMTWMTANKRRELLSIYVIKRAVYYTRFSVL